jgi:hypothetical protein
MRRETPAQIAKETFFWTLGGLVVIVLSGLMLFSSDPDNYYLNWAFDRKMFFLVLAIVFKYTVHRKTAMADQPAGGKLVACVSMVLWACVISAGSSSRTFAGRATFTRRSCRSTWWRSPSSAG